jgi:hypothetical protein
VRRAPLGCALLAALLAVQGCDMGKGWGLVEGCIHMPGCSLDPDEAPFETCAEDAHDFTFRPDFFSGEVFDDGSLTIRAQKGGYRIGESDGIVITVPDHSWVSEHLVADPDSVLEEEKLAVVSLAELDGLPVEERFKVSVYLNGSCPGSSVSFNEGVGTIWFHSMYQNRDDGDPRDTPLIHLEFDLVFVDAWPDLEPQPDSPRLDVHGELRFPYQRGSPAQPYP